MTVKFETPNAILSIKKQAILNKYVQQRNADKISNIEMEMVRLLMTNVIKTVARTAKTVGT